MQIAKKLIQKFALSIGATLLIVLPTAIAEPSAGQLKKMCINEAQATKKVCVNACNTTHKEAVGLCTSIAPACRVACVKAHKECVKPFNNELRACNDACKPALEEKRTACKTTCECGSKCNKNECFRECVKPALVEDFSCRRTCRDSWLLNTGIQDGLAACAETRRTCVAACKVTPEL